MLFESAILNAVSSTVVITVIPISFVFMMPSKGNLRLWLAFAVGGLLGDAFLHLIPHALESHNHGTEPPARSQFICNENTGVCVKNTVTLASHDDHSQCSHEQHAGHEHHAQDDHGNVHATDDHGHDHAQHDHVHDHAHDDHGHDHAHPKKDEHQHELRRRLHDEDLSGGHACDHGHGHAHDSHEHGHGHAHDLSGGLWIIVGLISFFCLDKYVRSLDNDGHSHSHGYSHGKKRDSKEIANAPIPPPLKVDTNLLSPEPKKRNFMPKTPKLMHLFFDEAQKDNLKARVDVKPSTIILNLLGDFAHNFTDGLAIGGSWSISPELGFSTTFAILFHEVPHEVADFAILLQAGLTKTEVVRTQLLTGGGALIGTIIGVMLHTMEASSWIPNFTAGGFIYIACANVIPELLVNCNLLETFKEVLTMCVSIGFMVAITYWE